MGRGKEARRSYMGHALMENRHGLVVDGLVSRATGEVERLAAEAMLLLRPERWPITLGADKAYDLAAFVAFCETRHRGWRGSAGRSPWRSPRTT